MRANTLREVQKQKCNHGEKLWFFCNLLLLFVFCSWKKDSSHTSTYICIYIAQNECCEPVSKHCFVCVSVCLSNLCCVPREVHSPFANDLVRLRTHIWRSADICIVLRCFASLILIPFIFFFGEKLPFVNLGCATKRIHKISYVSCAAGRSPMGLLKITLH